MIQSHTPDDQSLAAKFQRLIARLGPITVQHYMGESNARYYAGKDPLGSGGDFITAPEISQMFGEFIGLWLTDVWNRAGRPEPVHYVELGPGRGTLAHDALRVMKRQGLNPQVHFVEGSEALRAVQAQVAPHAQWHDDLSTLPDDAPLLIVGNEFLDALPVRQLVKTGQGWRERMVDCTDDGDGGIQFRPVVGDRPMDAAVPEHWQVSPEQTIIETCPGAAAVVDEIAGRLVRQGGTALLIDYGYSQSQTGSTLQALKDHTKVDPFAYPGEADLTCLVDFEAMAQTAIAGGARHVGTVTQGAFLRTLGIEMRAAQLTQAAPSRSEEIRVAKDRLIQDDQMGDLFKVMALSAPHWPDGVAFT